MGLLHGSSLYSPAAPAGNVTGCTAEDVGKNLHRRSDVYGKHTPGNYGCGCAAPGTERNKHCKNSSNMPLLKEMKGAQTTLGNSKSITHPGCRPVLGSACELFMSNVF